MFPALNNQEGLWGEDVKLQCVYSTTVWVYSMRKRNRHEALQKQGDIFTVQGHLYID